MAERIVRKVKEVPEFNTNSETISKKEELEEKLLEFVDQQITKIRKYCDLGNGPVGFFELNRALSEFSSINCSLIALDVMVKEECQKAQDDFEQFVAEKYVETREILNPISLSAAKWASSREIESYIMVKWKDEYWELKNKKDSCEKKVAFCRRLLDSLDAYRFNLSTLSKNAQTEVLGLNTQVNT